MAMSVAKMENSAEVFAALLSKVRPSRASTKMTASVSADTIIGARIRPILPDEVKEGSCSAIMIREKTKNVVDLYELKIPVRGPPKLNSSDYSLDHIFGPDDETETVYNHLVSPLIPFAWEGGVGTIFAYGQTGSGKTYTISGIEMTVAQTLFGETLKGRREVMVSIFEVMGSASYDLLTNRAPFMIVEDSLHEIQLLGVKEEKVQTSAELELLIDQAASFRRTELTEKNDSSSRSHAVCRIRLVNPECPSAAEGMLYIVDLAGSEAARDVAAHSKHRMKEAREINSSLSVLKECIRGRAQLDAGAARKKIFIPWRQTALTKALKHVFDPEAGRACRTSVIACVNPGYLDVGPSRNTLRYAEMLRVAIPKTEDLRPDQNIPKTWTNEMVKAWIIRNSGKPPVDPEVLAPFESGAQLIRLSETDFLARCQECEGVSPLRATAFYLKFWGLHIDSQKRQEPKHKAPASIRTSRAKTKKDAKLPPFKARIRPGMVVKFKPQWQTEADENFAVILCPEWAVGGTQSTAQSTGVNGGTKYLCAMVQPGSMVGAYTIAMWTQALIDIGDMKEEILLEYDVSSRFYYLQDSSTK